MPNKLKSFLILTVIFGSVFFVASQSLAAVDAGINEVGNSITLTSQSPLKIAANIINILMGFLGLLAICLILWGGFTWMTSNGSEEKIGQAKKILRNGVIGLVIILSAWGITYFILSRLLDATGGSGTGVDGCTNGASVSCGCGGAQTCNGGTWGPCLGSTCQPIIDSNTSCDGKTAVAECQADNNLCGDDYTCDETDCLCKPKASLGESCNANAGSNKCSADDNLCGPYLKCDPSSCTCVGSPVITGISPAGGFCANDQNRGCNLDSDCLGGAKCDASTPNGAANNFITIYGYNFGTSSNTFENFLTNIDFEQGAVGAVPTDWTTAAQKHSSVGIVTNDFRSGKQSVKIHQDPNLPYPGTCNKAVCQDMSNCIWNTADKTCHFSGTDQAHMSGPAVYSEGQTLVWGNSYNVMWAKLTYNLAPLNFKVGDTYSIQFYYKGKTAANTSVQISPNLGWSTQCVGYDYYAALKSGYTWDGSKVVPTPAEGIDPCGMGKTCSEQANACCMNTPYQKKCYGSLNLTSIPSGTIDDWTLYSYTFQYTPEMDTWLDSNGKKIIELGLSIGYNPTGAGTDLYIDDFTVTKVLNTGQVTFLGANASQSQLANFPKLLNANCVSYWTDRQITVAVPTGAATGPIQVKREGGITDNIDVTNNDNGPKIADFVKNNIYRPSICQISPTQGALGAKVGYQGINLKNSVAYFGEYSSAYKGINSTFSSDSLSGQTLAPSIIPGETTTFVERSLTGINQKSNALVFVKEKDPEAGPYISSFYPTTGPAGQYVTISGSGFGNMRGSRQVFFGDKEASYVFPEVCANSVWSDNQVVVKVPDGLSAGNYGIKINLGDTTINTDLLSPNNTFKFNPAESLKTSLCKIDPVRGQVGDKVSLWGEYFGNNGTDALVIFNRGISTSSKIAKDGLADKIETAVPISGTGVAAITGPVHVMKNGEWGNELNFTVGKCASNSECSASSPVCCPASTYKTGSCESSLLSCYFDVPNSVYETKFNTTLSGSTSDTDNTFDSCIDMATFYKGCQTGQFCPNSPGKCSPFNPIAPEVLGDCGSASSECGALSYCKDNASECTYNQAKDVCQTKKCILETELPYSLTAQVNGKNVVTNYKGVISCRAYTNKADGKTAFVKQLKVNTSCPTGWINIGEGYCVNAVPVTCNPCPTDFKCAEDANTTDDSGVCESNKICDSSSSCGVNPDNPAKFSCLKVKNKTCDCCCEIGQSLRDCCAPLTCAGTCGSDTTDDGAGYGSCSGCSAVGNTQQEHDNACNCSTAEGKFCDTSKAGGVCVDCAALDETGCSAHSSQCCFDQAKGVCQGGNGTLLPGGKCAYYDCDANNKATCNQIATTTGQFLATSTCVTKCATDSKTACDLIGSDAAACSKQVNCCFDNKNKICTDGTDKINLSGVNYCGYYNCDSTAKTCSGVASTTGEFLGSALCEKNCKATDSLPGKSCASEAIKTCDTSFCGDPYKCLSTSGDSPTTDECGTCCCKPGEKDGDLTCVADKGNCSGLSRGLFCGCTSDSQCEKNSQGCGGTCCQGRPNVVSTDPKNNDQNVCRNRQIEVKFDQEMNALALASNILLVEEKEYGTDTCPSGTTLSFNNFKPKATNFLVRLYQAVTDNIKHLFSGTTGDSAIAAGPSPDKLYCVSPITVETETGYTNGATSTIAYIQPQKLLAAQTNYFVVVKGDESLDSNSGVMSMTKVGLNGSMTTNNAHINNPEFNGVAFKNSYAFGFTTMSDNSGKNGLCTISSVAISPDSFLIKTADNDASDDNPGDTATFDKKSDNDRAVSAFAYSSDNQLLQPIPGYSWNWDWKIIDISVAEKLNISGLKSNQMVVKAVSGVTDKSTKIAATVNMTGFQNASFEGNNLSGTSELYVFLCANPWPMEINGRWNPWADKCTDSLGNSISGCLNYNYKFYYCRDAGEKGTADDLPAVADPALILGSSGSLICSTNGNACGTSAKAGDSCGSGGTCIWNILKESYFFREAIPQSGEITEIRSTGAGKQIFLSWKSPVSTVAPITSFKVYYGLTSGTASSYITSLTLSQASCNVQDNINYCSYLVNNLVDGEKYYFKVSALTDKKAESPLSGSKEVIPTDTTAPAAPTGLKVEATNDGKLTISWKANSDDALYYRLFHGIFSGKRASDSVDSPNNATSMTFNQSDYRAGDHFFYLAAIDKSGNVSPTSDEVKITITSATSSD